jgi:hypothetical protein
LVLLYKKSLRLPSQKLLGKNEYSPCSKVKWYAELTEWASSQINRCLSSVKCSLHTEIAMVKGSSIYSSNYTKNLH